MPDLDALFRPRSIVLVGVSPDRTIIRGRIVEAVTLHGFDGPLHAVSRSHDEIAGITCYPSVDALPGPVDLAIITIPAKHVAATLRACAEIGAKAAIVISSGFGEERGEAGTARQSAIAAIATEFDMAVLGPNAEGFLNGRMPLAATFSPAVVHVENGLRPQALSDAAVGAGVGVDGEPGAGPGAGAGVEPETRHGAGGAGPRTAFAPGTVMCEHDAKELLAAHGIGGIPAGGLALDATAAARIAGEIGGPVAMKVQSSDLPHKSDARAIALGVEEESAVHEAFARIMNNARAFAPSAVIEGVRVERMAGPGVELIVGVSRDPDFGPMIGVGLGGVLVELLDDFVLSPAPVDAVEAREMLRNLRGQRILDGLRGAPAADVDALVRLLVAVSEFAAAAGETLEALDLNPVIVHPRGEGVSVVDAGIVTRAVRRFPEHGTCTRNGGDP